MYYVKDGCDTAYRTVVINNKCDTKIEEYLRKQHGDNSYLEKVSETASMYYFDAYKWLLNKGYLRLIPVSSGVSKYIPENGVNEVCE